MSHNEKNKKQCLEVTVLLCRMGDHNVDYCNDGWQLTSHSFTKGSANTSGCSTFIS